MKSYKSIGNWEECGDEQNDSSFKMNLCSVENLPAEAGPFIHNNKYKAVEWK